MNSSSKQVTGRNTAQNPQICPQCEHQFTRSDNLKRHLKNSCKGVALNKVMKRKFENEAQSSSKKKSNDNKKEKVNIRCNECQEDVPKAHYRGHLRSNRHKINACRFIDDEGAKWYCDKCVVDFNDPIECKVAKLMKNVVEEFRQKIKETKDKIETELLWETQPSESEIIDQILRNLNPYFSERVSLHDVDTLDRLKELCRKVQDVKSRIDKYHPPPQKRSVLLEPDLAYVGLRCNEIQKELKTKENGEVVELIETQSCDKYLLDESDTSSCGTGHGDEKSVENLVESQPSNHSYDLRKEIKAPERLIEQERLSSVGNKLAIQCLQILDKLENKIKSLSWMSTLTHGAEQNLISLDDKTYVSLIAASRPPNGSPNLSDPFVCFSGIDDVRVLIKEHAAKASSPVQSRFFLIA
ncbi:hypothetical protein RN001_006714 [Aquatica leii]|uniref:C2H2-type domain-containing protein n=1 Tax=Aquatica leii TaxID=1421715 RepID=A0AAN7SSA9_9COLE|nr:hypothetical protein RN001_006714 [Aquatica leii]